MPFDPRKDYYRQVQREPIHTAQLGGGMSITFVGWGCAMCKHHIRRHDKDGCWGKALRGGRCPCRLTFVQVEEARVLLPHPNERS